MGCRLISTRLFKLCPEKVDSLAVPVSCECLCFVENRLIFFNAKEKHGHFLSLLLSCYSLMLKKLIIDSFQVYFCRNKS